jgi:release factor glutamine methyltransferase
MTWRETIQKTAAFLESKNVPEARTAGELLAARLLKTGRGFLSSKLECEVAENYLEAMRRAMQRLIKGEPLQYVLGEWDFRYLTLKCDSRALIPRPETEELVQLAIDFLNSQNLERPVVIDVGTGTGAIILSIASEYKKDGIFVGTDISGKAISLARENASLLGLAGRVKMAIGDGLDDFDEPESVDVIISNPPYIKSSECKLLDPRVKDFEPLNALDGGESGIVFYDRYLSDAFNLLKPGGAVFFEIGHDQGSQVAKLMYEYGFSDICIKKDLSGKDRFATCRLYA